MTQTRFDDFWEESSLDRHGARDYAAALGAASDAPKTLRPAYPWAPRPLPSPRSGLARIATRRRSERSFAAGPLTDTDWGRVLGALRAVHGPERRTYASAGATFPVETVVVVFASETSPGAVWAYDAVAHGVIDLRRAAPTWDEAWKSLGLTAGAAPAAVILGVVFSDRVTAKYGSRGERFAMLDAGAMLQQLGLAVAERRGLAGLALGGAYDRHWLDIVGIDPRQARLGFTYAVGRAPRGARA